MPNTLSMSSAALRQDRAGVFLDAVEVLRLIAVPETTSLRWFYALGLQSDQVFARAA